MFLLPPTPPFPHPFFTLFSPKAYGAGYEWDRCGKLSQACERFFVQEACLYECDPNIGNYRKCTDAQVVGCVEQL